MTLGGRNFLGSRRVFVPRALPCAFAWVFLLFAGPFADGAPPTAFFLENTLDYASLNAEMTTAKAAWDKAVALTCAKSLAINSDALRGKIWWSTSSAKLEAGQLDAASAVACSWPAVMQELEDSSRDLDVAGSRGPALTRTVASGIYEASLFSDDPQIRPVEDRVARWLFAIRMTSQVWPFAASMMRASEGRGALPLAASARALVEAWALGSSPWSISKQIFLSTDCGLYGPACDEFRARLLLSLDAAVRAIATTEQYLRLARIEASATDAILSGHDQILLSQTEALVNSFTGNGPSYYFVGLSATAGVRPLSVFLELRAWLQEFRDELSSYPLYEIPFSLSPCENLQLGVRSIFAEKAYSWPANISSKGFACADEAGAPHILDDRLLMSLANHGFLLRFATQHVRGNILSLFAPGHRAPGRQRLLLFRHYLKDLERLAAWINDPAIKAEVDFAATKTKPIDSFVGSLTNDFRQTAAVLTLEAGRLGKCPMSESERK